MSPTIKLWREDPSAPPGRTKVLAGVVVAGIVATLCLLGSMSPSTARSYAYPPSPSPTFPTPKLISSPTPHVHSPSRVQLQTSLLATLRGILDRPVLSHADSFPLQHESCPKITSAQISAAQVYDDRHWWAQVGVAELEHARANVVWSVAATLGLTVANETNVCCGRWEALFGDGRRGIVFTGGNQDTARRILTSLKILRTYLSCTLPVEIWAFEEELSSLPRSLRREIEALGQVQFRVSRLTKGDSPSSRKRQYKIKGEAIARSGFSEVLYLDSDNIPARDPTFLFDSLLFKEHGMILWPDFPRDSPSNPIWRLTGKNCDPDAWTAETGQLLANKLAQGGMVLAALLAAEAMQQDHKFWFRLSQGDKDTFRYAFYLLGLPFSPAPHFLSAAGSPTDSFQGHIHCGHTMLQYGLSSSEWELPDVQKLVRSGYSAPADHAPPLFVHANLLKYSAGLGEWFPKDTYKYRRGNTFQTIKLITSDRMGNASSSRIQDDLRYSVYRHRGLCTDLWDAGATNSGLQTPFDSGEVETVAWDHAWGGMLRGFEDMFYSSGGLTA